MKTPRSFVAALARTRLDSVFNPYAEACPEHDRADAPALRRRNLEAWLEAALVARVDTIWIARDLGYRGGRRTGLPLTDEVHLKDAGTLLGGIEFHRATRGPVVAERTAAIVWRMLTAIAEPAVLWNVFPLHPHGAGDPLSNRCHTRTEREATAPLLRGLIAIFRPRRIVAIGRDAQLALEGLDIPVTGVRHPSYGGQADFIAGIAALYGVDPERPSASPQLPLDHAASAGLALA
ncbi:uracil-DNA glycosylase [Sphingomonas sp. Root710]|uniref:uracil-DNA glycosylase n=1 Tax=Sphingomonas sp. Root710 TaxID=1736594 RepID=UPI0006FD38E0|nr:uracil-DNA glycosylase [Sphingomonas sp. Root710]KRB86712.1 uracil-DNA glycosylase [Sphingomonas sp. Root710]